MLCILHSRVQTSPPVQWYYEAMLARYPCDAINDSVGNYYYYYYYYYYMVDNAQNCRRSVLTVGYSESCY